MFFYLSMVTFLMLISCEFIMANVINNTQTAHHCQPYCDDGVDNDVPFINSR